MSLGFSHIGYCAALPPPNFDRYLDWVDQGYAGGMSYLSRPDALEKRADPRKLLPSAESIMVFAMPYQPTTLEDNDPARPSVAAYAWGEDYHHVIPAQLEKLMGWLRGKTGTAHLEYRIFTDSGPLLERSYAVAAGLGWIGKNACLIIPGRGSFCFLAEILINLKFTPDPPFLPDLCGSCQRCIQVCPTDCILDNRSIDASRCISYLTIENKAEIALDLREKLGYWIFGCDICQQVCPWNLRFARPPGHGFFEKSVDVDQLTYHSFVEMDDLQFKQRFKDSPLSRPKLKGMKRNTVTAMGNTCDPLHLPVLHAAAQSESDPMVKEHIEWAREKLVAGSR